MKRALLGETDGGTHLEPAKLGTQTLLRILAAAVKERGRPQGGLQRVHAAVVRGTHKYTGAPW